MFNAVSEAQRDVITVLVFIVTFFVALGIGRFLKRRAGVQLGLLFRLFCLTLAFYAAITVYGVHAPCTPVSKTHRIRETFPAGIEPA